ncbi:MAG TPA: DUF4291 domain-containing protein [Chitinophagales bacterium]|nr:DUF4291 domain-containing protein [Chitinophagales bacterium]
MELELYEDSVERLPKTGQVILAAQSETSITVYQAYRPAIAKYAAQNQQFGGEYSFSRMSWIKPNFLWMMYRSGWAVKEGQEHILAITIAKTNFDKILEQAVHSSFNSKLYETNELWKQRMEQADVRLQWDPDHDPYGNKLERRAIQLGLKGDILKSYGTIWVEQIADITEFVNEQRKHVENKELNKLQVPYETIYTPAKHINL